MRRVVCGGVCAMERLAHPLRGACFRLARWVLAVHPVTVGLQELVGGLLVEGEGLLIARVAAGTVICEDMKKIISTVIKET